MVEKGINIINNYNVKSNIAVMVMSTLYISISLVISIITSTTTTRTPVGV